MSFLKAEWRKLILANYEVEPQLLKPYLPAFTELDFWQGRCYVSLVGFMFLNTKLLGRFKIPFHVNFEEVNLRFYVRHRAADGTWRRGVVFIRELVPRLALSLVANTIYGEHYRTVPMRHSWSSKPEQQALEVVYEWRQAGQWQQLSVLAHEQALDLVPDSEAEFITEHYWGYSRQGKAKTTEYEVRHPPWQTYAVKSHGIAVDFGQVYGADWAFLNQTQPLSVMLAEGSAISVESKQNLYKENPPLDL